MPRPGLNSTKEASMVAGELLVKTWVGSLKQSRSF